MKKTSRIKAFSLIELMVVMLLSGLTISIGYAMYSIIVKQQSDFMTKSNKVHEIVTLMNFLSHDEQQAQKVIKSSEGFTFVCEEETWKYVIGKEAVLREDGAGIEKVNIKIEHYTLQWEGEEQLVPKQLIDKIEIDVNYKETLIPILVTKKYAAKELMNFEANTAWQE